MASRVRTSVELSGQEFERKESLLATDLVGKLKQEHEREIQVLTEEQVFLRAELARVVDLLQREILPREKQMHELIDGMQESYLAATQTLHSRLSERVETSLLDAASQKRQEMLDPMQAMETELERIAKLLSHETAKPDIAGWQGAGPPRSTAPFTPSPRKPRGGEGALPVTGPRAPLVAPSTAATATGRGAGAGSPTTVTRVASFGDFRASQTGAMGSTLSRAASAGAVGLAATQSSGAVGQFGVGRSAVGTASSATTGAGGAPTLLGRAGLGGGGNISSSARGIASPERSMGGISSFGERKHASFMPSFSPSLGGSRACGTSSPALGASTSYGGAQVGSPHVKALTGYASGGDGIATKTAGASSAKFDKSGSVCYNVWTGVEVPTTAMLGFATPNTQSTFANSIFSRRGTPGSRDASNAWDLGGAAPRVLQF